MCMSVLSALCTVRVPGAYRGQNRLPDLLELESQSSEPPYGCWNGIWVLCKNNNAFHDRAISSAPQTIMFKVLYVHQ